MRTPLVSVIIPVYNAGAYVKEAIQSVLNQTYNNLEVIVINDGSTDDSDEIIKSTCACDNRVRYVSRENKGLVFTLNQAISLATGDFIARMDADDICYLDRIEQQLNFLLANPSCDVCFCGVRVINHDGVVISEDARTISDAEITVRLFFSSCFYHPSAMLRRHVFLNYHYDDNYKYAEDYKLWSELVNDGINIEIFPAVLLKYRVHDKNISLVRQFEQLEISKKIGFCNFIEYCPQLTQEEYECLADSYFYRGRYIPSLKIILFTVLGKTRCQSFFVFLFLLKIFLGKTILSVMKSKC